MPIIRRTKTVYYCIWCFALVVLDVAGCRCGALQCNLHALLTMHGHRNIQLIAVCCRSDLDWQ